MSYLHLTFKWFNKINVSGILSHKRLQGERMIIQVKEKKQMW